MFVETDSQTSTNSGPKELIYQLTGKLWKHDSDPLLITHQLSGVFTAGQMGETFQLTHSQGEGQ